ncbi:hypothetical protein SAMN05192545_3914 [Maribacter dokdonensis]|uniref:Uncharacterized protein n=1 Tax=Maribacter dokdonensis TaxID=320912 RepID=A0ABY0V0J3_9FLAO|nr:hypothetical protein [Maribacter dokdonensis]SDT46916.1 hypothetical protein SAMN05192545_3914 [Maribacter dokdonensis]
MNKAEQLIDKVFRLAQNPDFIKVAVEMAKQTGTTAKEWNANKTDILLFFASKTISNGLDKNFNY